MRLSETAKACRRRLLTAAGSLLRFNILTPHLFMESPPRFRCSGPSALFHRTPDASCRARHGIGRKLPVLENGASGMLAPSKVHSVMHTSVRSAKDSSIVNRSQPDTEQPSRRRTRSSRAPSWRRSDRRHTGSSRRRALRGKRQRSAGSW